MLKYPNAAVIEDMLPCAETLSDASSVGYVLADREPAVDVLTATMAIVHPVLGILPLDALLLFDESMCSGIGPPIAQ